VLGKRHGTAQLQWSVVNQIWVMVIAEDPVTRKAHSRVSGDPLLETTW